MAAAWDCPSPVSHNASSYSPWADFCRLAGTTRRIRLVRATLRKRLSAFLPGTGRLREHGILGIELMGLCALYLQVSDRKEEVYLYVS